MDVVRNVVGLLVVAVGVLSTDVAHAENGIVLESYAGKRNDDVSRVLAPLHEELTKRDFVTGEALGRRYDAKVSRAAVTASGLPADFADVVERGHKAWINGKFDEAVSILVPLIDAAHANPGAFAQNQPMHDRLAKAQIALALSQQRKGDIAAAKETLGELLRSFPQTQLSRAAYGPDAVALFDQVRKALGKGGRGRLVVKSPSDNAVVFINEHFENLGTITKGELWPGTYRVYLQLAKQLSRVHSVVVNAEQDAQIAIDLAYDGAIQTSRGWTGFLFASAADRDKHEAKYAVTFAREVGAPSVVVVGVEPVRGRPALVGSLVDINNAREIRRASLALEPEPSAERVRSLARFLAGDVPTEGLDVELGGETVVAGAVDDGPEESPGQSKRWMLWTGVAAIGAGAVASGLAIKFALDASAAGDEVDRICSMPCTKDQYEPFQIKQRDANRNAIISGVVGGAAIATGVVFVVLSRRGGGTQSVAVMPSSNGVFGALGGTF